MAPSFYVHVCVITIYIFGHAYGYDFLTQNALIEWTIEDIINKTDEFYLKLCGGCNGEFGSYGLEPGCVHCQCDPDCVRFGDCCDQAANNVSLIEFTCINSIHKVNMSPIVMGTLCNGSYENETIRSRCQHTPDCPSLPVITDGGIIYVNKYCAMCNFKTNFKSWTLEYYPSYDDILRSVIDIFQCKRQFSMSSPPGIAPLHLHRPCVPNKTQVINTCNKTGLWTVYREDLETLCQSNKYRKVFKLYNIYNNIFCFLCNGYSVKKSDASGQSITEIVNVVDFTFNQDVILLGTPEPADPYLFLDKFQLESVMDMNRLHLTLAYPEKFYEDVCTKCEKRKKGPISDKNFRCVRCNCDVGCVGHKDCCIPNLNTKSNDEFSCERYLSKQVYMKTKCADNFTDQSIINQCHQPLICPSPPVSTNQGITYINQFCAVCNHETNFTTWDLEWSFSSKKLYKNVRDIFQCSRSLKADVNTKLPLRKCPRYIDKCFKPHRNDVKQKCENGDKFELIRLKKTIYKNIFCYICHRIHFRNLMPSGPIVDIVKFDKIPNTEDHMKVRLHNLHPFQNISLEIQCNEGFNLTNGQCIVDAELHQLFIGVQLNTSSTNITHSNTHILDTVKFRLKEFENFVAVITQESASIIDIKVFFVLPTKKLDILQKAKEKLYLDWLIEDDVLTPELNYHWMNTEQYVDYDTVYYVPDDVNCRCLNKDPQKLPSEEFILFTNQFNCSFVEYELHDFRTGIDESKELGNLTVSNDEYTVYGTKVRICVDTIRDKYKSLLHKTSVSTLNYNLSIWIMVCLAISIFCLLFTFITFCIFPVLRTLPCKNNMVLIVFLILGQLLLFFSYKPQKGSLVCKCYGVTVHYVWLCVIFWMNICSFHMYRVFRSTNISAGSSTNHCKILLKYAIYGNGLPIVIVSAVIVGKYVTSGYIGYGLNQCYLDTPFLVIISLITPLTITIVCNVAFLSVTIWSIAKTSNMARQVGKDRHHILIYIKLSTLTGLFWILSILGNFYNVNILSYIAIFLNYGQGIFIFLSYIVNKRVVNMWLGLCGKSLPQTSTTSSGKGTKSTT